MILCVHHNTLAVIKVLLFFFLISKIISRKECAAAGLRLDRPKMTNACLLNTGGISMSTDVCVMSLDLVNLLFFFSATNLYEKESR